MPLKINEVNPYSPSRICGMVFLTQPATIMKSILKLIPAFFVFSQPAFSQNDSTAQKLTFKLSANYHTGLNYYGRTDSLKSTGSFPLAELWFSKNVYVNAAPIFINNAVQSFSYAGTVTTLGYLHTTNRWITNMYVSKPFYKQNSTLVQSALKAQTALSFSKLTKIINITAGGDLKFSDKIDYGATAAIDHTIKKVFKGNYVLVVDPSIYAYAGTQNFTNTYYKKTAGFLFFPGTSQAVIQSVQRFNILAYEASIPIVLVKGKWMALITPSYIVPQNLITVPNQPQLSEKGENLLYATIGLKYSF